MNNSNTDYNKITTAKMLAGTKNILRELNVEGRNEQEKIDSIIRIYKEQVDAASGDVLGKVQNLDLTDDFKSISKDLNIFFKGVEQKVNKLLQYNTDVIALNTQNDFKKLHKQFLEYIDNAQITSLEVERELEEKKQEISIINKEISSLKAKEEDMKKSYEDINDRCSKSEKERASIEQECDILKGKYSKVESSLKESESEKQEIKTKLEGAKLDIRKLETSLDELRNMNSLLKSEMIKKDAELSKLSEENKNIKELKEHVESLTKRNAELEAKLKSSEVSNSTLQTTLNTINTVISSTTEARVNAETSMLKLQEENRRLKEALELSKNK